MKRLRKDSRFHSSRSRGTIAFALVFAIVVISITAQLQTEQSVTKSSAPGVKLNVLVLDDSKRAVNDINQNEFRIFEDDVEQQISFFSREQVPITYGLLVDNSGSLRSQFMEVIEAGKRIVNANRPEDEAFVMRFVDNKNIDILRDFTSDKSALDRSLDGLHVEGGQTALLDAVFVAAIRLAKRTQDDTNQARRQALILISDGEDRDSTSKADELFDFLQKNDIQIYVIGLVSQLDNDRGSSFGRKPTRGESIELLNRLAKETGGQAFFPKSPVQFSDIVSDIMRDLRTQYIIGYNPLPNPKSKAYRNVKVKLEREKGAAKRTVITRSGYVVLGK
jgi:Ca-activated chloride channel homolog